MKKFIFQLITLCLLSVAGYCQFSGSTSYVLTAASGGSSYQWYKDGTAISGATSASYTATAPGAYYAAFNNGTCNTTTPTTVIANSGTSVTFNASSTFGTYQWNNASSGTATAISGATSATYATTTGGIYNVTVTGSSCTPTSNNYYLYYLSTSSGPCAAGTTAPSVN